MIKVLIVDDSPVVREHLRYLLDSDPDMCVVGTAKDGKEAVELAEYTDPDIITMDVHMPGMDGFEATRTIMENHPVPVVIVSGSWDQREVEMAFLAIQAGAVAVLEKPAGIGHPGHEKSAKELIESIKLMSEVKVVKRWTRTRRMEFRSADPPDIAVKSFSPPIRTAPIRLVAIGASTGGPPVLHTLLSTLPKDFPVPLMIIQHIAPGFLPGLVEWLSQGTGFPARIATHAERPLPGHAYFAPDDQHMGVEKSGRIILCKAPPENSLRPSISYLFRSVARAFENRSVGVLLTGMGKDGAEELMLMRERGAVTIVQDKESSVVHGMPGEAIKLGAATHVLSPERIGAMLKSLGNVAQKEYK